MLCQFMGRVTARRPDGTPTCAARTSTRAHRRRVAPAGHPPCRGGRRAGLQAARRAPRGRRLVRGRRVVERHRPRVDELRRCAAPAGGVRHRQQPVRLLDADEPQLRLRDRWPCAPPPTASRACRRRHRRDRCLSRGRARHREGPLRRRPDAAGDRHPAYARPRRARRRGLRARWRCSSDGARPTRSPASATGSSAEAGWTAEDEAALEAELAGVVDDAVTRAEASPWPDPATLTDGVYAG